MNGLAWTEAGGEILEVEVNVMEGSGKLELTGNLGDVMKESAQAALSCLRSRAAELGIEPDFYKTKDIHVHFPEGAVPKDGPSAGIAVTTAMLSALTGRKIKAGIAMTGEVTLRGRVLPIGGLKEKTMAALRNGISTVLIPKDNVRDLEEIDQTVRAALRFVPVETVDQVFAAALCARSRTPVREEVADRVAAFAPAGRESGQRRRPAAVKEREHGFEFCQSGVCPLRRPAGSTFIRDGLPQFAFAGRSNVGRVLRHQPAGGPEEPGLCGRLPGQDHPGQLLPH